MQFYKYQHYINIWQIFLKQHIIYYVFNLELNSAHITIKR